MVKMYGIYILFVLLSACKAKSVLQVQQLDLSKYLEVSVVDARSLDGCKFLLEDKHSFRYQPVNLPDSVSLNGKNIFILYTNEKDLFTTCMGGKLIRITDIKVLKK